MKKIILYSLLMLLALHASAQKRTKVACVGNSITYGYTLPERETQAYPARLQQMLGDAYQVGNFGKSGATLLNRGHRPYMQQEEYRKAMAFAGDIVVIHLGINDTENRHCAVWSKRMWKWRLLKAPTLTILSASCKGWAMRSSTVPASSTWRFGTKTVKGLCGWTVLRRSFPNRN